LGLVVGLGVRRVMAHALTIINAAITISIRLAPVHQCKQIEEVSYHPRGSTSPPCYSASQTDLYTLHFSSVSGFLIYGALISITQPSQCVSIPKVKSTHHYLQHPVISLHVPPPTTKKGPSYSMLSTTLPPLYHHSPDASPSVVRDL
jgi:hypothetical protein